MSNQQMFMSDRTYLVKNLNQSVVGLINAKYWRKCFCCRYGKVDMQAVTNISKYTIGRFVELHMELIKELGIYVYYRNVNKFFLNVRITCVCICSQTGKYGKVWNLYKKRRNQRDRIFSSTKLDRAWVVQKLSLHFPSCGKVDERLDVGKVRFQFEREVQCSAEEKNETCAFWKSMECLELLDEVDVVLGLLCAKGELKIEEYVTALSSLQDDELE